jgi:multiple sugar transport system ATP-binding protein
VPEAEIKEAVTKAAKTLHIEHLLERKPKDLSGGQRQRVAIGRAIVRQPEVFLFDEPLSNLDTALRVKMRYEFAKLHEQFKTTMVYVTHDQVEAMTLADRIVVLQAGRIEQVGAPLELYEHPCNLFVAGFIGSPGMNLLDATVAEASAQHAVVRVKGSDEPIRCLVDAGAARPGDAVKLGVRPEHLRAGEAANALATEVTFVESLGGMTYAYCSHPGVADVLTCAVEGDRRLASGSALSLGVPPAKAYLFDADGKAFRRLAAAPTERAHAA